MNRNYVTLLFLTALLAGCRFARSPVDATGIAGSWTLDNVAAQYPERVDMNDEARMKGAVEVGSMLSLFADGSFTKTEGNGEYIAGSWRMVKDSSLAVLTTRKGDTEQTTLQIEAPWIQQPSYELVMVKGDFLYKYIKAAAPLDNYREDPFYSANNQWRVTPQQPEDSAQVRERFANYLRHMALLLKAAKQRQQAVVSFMYSQGPVKIYSGGIGALPFGKVRRSWKNGFYDDMAARYAYGLFGEYLQEDHDMGAGTGDWIDDDYHILMTMYPAFHARQAKRGLHF